MIFSKSSIGLLTLVVAVPVTLDRAMATTNTVIVQQQNTTELSDRAKQLYLDERYAEASQIWQQAVIAFQEQQDTLNQAMALSNLALTQQKLGDLITAEKNIISSIELLEKQATNTSRQTVLASSLDIKGAIERSRVNFQKALNTWRQAEDIYQQLDNQQAIVKNQINQALVLQDLGYYRRANKILQSVQEQLVNDPNSLAKITVLLSFGNTLRATGNLEQSLIILQEANKIAEELNAIERQKVIFLSLGNTLRALGNRQERPEAIAIKNSESIECFSDLDSNNNYYLRAASCYQASALSNNLATKTKAQLNLLSLSIENPDILQTYIPNLKNNNSQKPTEITRLIAQIQTNLNQLPTTRSTIYDRLNLVQSPICLQPNTVKISSPIVQQCKPLSNNDVNNDVNNDAIISWQEIESEINVALQQAEQLQDNSARAYALGYLGAVYQQTEQLDRALQSTRQALLTTNAPETTYLWQWQLGRIYQLQNESDLALEAYNAAFAALQSVRANLVAINPEMQFAFRDRIEPIYRERAALLLRDNPSQENLLQARNTIEALQLAELNNFFQEACIDAIPQQIEQIDPDAAVIYSIILEDRVAIILSQPEKPLQYHQTAIANAREVDRTYEDLYANLSPFLAVTDPLKPNQTFYNWLIRPFESQLKANDSNTLVFILDGVMRGIPVASLHDGEEYLIEKYNLALTPGLQLFASRTFTGDRLQTVAAGLTESRQGFKSLPNVETEVTEIASLIPSEVLLNENFTRDSLRLQVANNPYPIVHLATHGQFSSRAEDTFLLTWSDRINVRDLDRILQERDFTEDIPIELLILSACQTATGDKQAALGLAGVAVRSGARSTLATLWSIQDDSTAELMTQFYRALKTPEITKAEALRQAQLSLLQNPQYQHPFYWSAFVLVGNWL